MIGPSGCGKSTLLKSLNRMNDLVEGCKVEGTIQIGGQNIYERGANLAMLRKNVGMVFQRPNPFAMSVYDNVAYGPVSYTHLLTRRARACFRQSSSFRL